MVRSGPEHMQNMDALLKRLDRIIAIRRKRAGIVAKLIYDPCSITGSIARSVIPGLVNQVAQGKVR